jgi:hypothetical protein
MTARAIFSRVEMKYQFVDCRGELGKTGPRSRSNQVAAPALTDA